MSDGVRRLVRSMRWPFVLVAVGVLVLLILVGPLSRSAFEESLSKALARSDPGAVSIRSVECSVFVPRLAVRGLSIASPAGFAAAPAIEISELKLSTSIRDLLGEALEIESVEIAHAKALLDSQPQGRNLMLMLGAVRERIARLRGLGPSALARRFKVGRVTIDRLEIELRGELAEPDAEAPVLQVSNLSFEASDRFYATEELVEMVLASMIDALRRHPGGEVIPPAIRAELLELETHGSASPSRPEPPSLLPPPAAVSAGSASGWPLPEAAR